MAGLDRARSGTRARARRPDRPRSSAHRRRGGRGARRRLRRRPHETQATGRRPRAIRPLTGRTPRAQGASPSSARRCTPPMNRSTSAVPSGSFSWPRSTSRHGPASSASAAAAIEQGRVERGAVDRTLLGLEAEQRGQVVRAAARGTIARRSRVRRWHSRRPRRARRRCGTWTRRSRGTRRSRRSRRATPHRRIGTRGITLSTNRSHENAPSVIGVSIQPGQDRVRADAVACVLDREALHHRDDRRPSLTRRPGCGARPSRSTPTR